MPVGWSTWMAIFVPLAVAYLPGALGWVSAYWGAAWPFERLDGGPETIQRPVRCSIGPATPY